MLSHKSASIILTLWLSIAVSSYASQQQTIEQRLIMLQEQSIKNDEKLVQEQLSEVAWLKELIKANIAKHDYYHQIALNGYAACHAKDSAKWPAIDDSKIKIIEDRAPARAKIATNSLRKFPDDIQKLDKKIKVKEAYIEQAKKELQELKVAAFAEQPATIIDILEGPALEAWLQT